MSESKTSVKIKSPKNTNTIFGLPAKSYTDNEFWDKECETALADGWLFIAFAHEFKKVGDVVPVYIAGKPILLIKNEENKITAFHNVCSHRCLKLVDEKKNIGKLIRCPYHSWTYDLQGNLKAAPHIGGTNIHKPKGFNFKNHGLKPIRIHIWHDWIFVNINGKAKKFNEYAKPLISKFKDLDLTKIKYAATLDFGKINTNWKFLDKEDNKNSSALSVSSKYLSLFPNFIIGTYYPNQIGVYLNIPIGPGITSQKRIIYSTEGKSMSKEEIDITKKIWWSVHKEDHEMCERLQEGRSSPASNDGGLLSPHWEKGVQKFQKLIIQATMKSKKIMKGKKNV